MCTLCVPPQDTAYRNLHIHGLMHSSMNLTDHLQECWSPEMGWKRPFLVEKDGRKIQLRLCLKTGSTRVPRRSEISSKSLPAPPGARRQENKDTFQSERIPHEVRGKTKRTRSCCNCLTCTKGDTVINTKETHKHLELKHKELLGTETNRTGINYGSNRNNIWQQWQRCWVLFYRK